MQQSVYVSRNGGVLNTLLCYASVATMAAKAAILGDVFTEFSEPVSYFTH